MLENEYNLRYQYIKPHIFIYIHICMSNTYTCIYICTYDLNAEETVWGKRLFGGDNSQRGERQGYEGEYDQSM